VHFYINIFVNVKLNEIEDFMYKVNKADMKRGNSIVSTEFGPPETSDFTDTGIQIGAHDLSFHAFCFHDQQYWVTIIALLEIFDDYCISAVLGVFSNKKHRC